MSITIIFSKQGEPELEETFMNKDQAKRWIRLIEENGYTVTNVEEVK